MCGYYLNAGIIRLRALYEEIRYQKIVVCIIKTKLSYTMHLAKIDKINNNKYFLSFFSDCAPPPPIMQRRHSDKPGSTGCRVFKRGVQNLKHFCVRINIPKGNCWILRIELGSLQQLAFLYFIILIFHVKNWKASVN